MPAPSLKNNFNDPSLHNDFVVQAGERTGRWFWKDMDVGQMLKEHPEAVKWTDWEGRTALISAVEAGNIENAKLLLAAGADPNAEDRQGRTALHLTAEQIEDWTPAMIDLLADHHAKIDATDKRGQTPLMKAAQNRNGIYAMPTMEKLLKRGANPDHKDVDDNSPISLLQAQYDAISVKSPTSFTAVNRVAPVLDMLKYWSELRKLSQDIRPASPSAPKS